MIIIKILGAILMLIILLLVFKVNLKYKNKYLRFDIETTFEKSKDD